MLNDPSAESDSHEGGAQRSSWAITPFRFRLRWIRNRWRLGVGLISMVAVGVIWQICADTGVVDPQFSSSPHAVYQAEVAYFAHGTGWFDLSRSGIEFGVAMTLAMLIAVPLGLAIGYYPIVSALFQPFINGLYQTPVIALATLLILWFGLGMPSKIALAFVFAVSPIVIVTASGVRTLERRLLNVPRVYHATDWQIFRTLVLPGTVPSIIAGVRLGLGLCLVGVIGGELFASSSGIGHEIQLASQVFNVGQILACVAVVSFAGLLFTTILRLVERRLEKWRVY